MGQKVDSNALRYGINKDWESRWITRDNQERIRWISEDLKIRKVLFDESNNNKLNNKSKAANISKIEIERTKTEITLFIHCVRPGAILGQGGSNIENLKKLIQKTIKNRKINIKINVVPILEPDLDARLLAKFIAYQIENRLSPSRLQQLAITRAFKAGAKGIKTKIGGRINGADMARVIKASKGSVSLGTFKSDIDYASVPAKTVSGIIGVKVWVCKGELLSAKKTIIRRPNNFNHRNARNYKNPSDKLNHHREVK